MKQSGPPAATKSGQLLATQNRQISENWPRFGGGAKPGTIYGATDDFGFKVAQNPVHVHDLHATALHLLGLDHEKLTFRYAGRNFRLTDVEGRVVKDIVT